MSDILAVVFDYDDTIVPDSTTQLLEQHGINARGFWEQSLRLTGQGYDTTHAYLRLLIDNIGEEKPLGPLTNAALREFGGRVEETMYPGLPELISDLRAIVKQYNYSVEFYIVSGGLEEVILGNSLVAKEFTAVYGCTLGGDEEEGPLKYIKRAVTFSEKTKYIFEINKGILPSQALTNPMAVNDYVDPKTRRVPLQNMIYIGDGLTDIPCFSLIRNNNGDTFGVFHRRKDLSKKMRIYSNILKPNRILGTYYPEYGEEQQLGEMIRLAASTWCAKKAIRTDPYN